MTPLGAGQAGLVTFAVVLSTYLLTPMPSSVVDTPLGLAVCLRECIVRPTLEPRHRARRVSSHVGRHMVIERRLSKRVRGFSIDD